VNSFIISILRTVDDAKILVVRIYWGTLIFFLLKHWLIILIVLFLVFFTSLIRAISGRWGLFGSVMYNYLYFGILFIVGLTWGPEIFVSNLFTIICTVALYPLCYFLVGMILQKLGLKY